MKKRIVAILLSTVMVLATLTGCAGKSVENAGTNAPAKEETKKEPESSEPESYAFEETKEFTILMPSWQTEGDNRMHQVWSERMNAKITFITAPADAYEEKLSAELAGGDLPDIVSFSTKEGSSIPETWVKQGALLPLDDLIAEYGQDYSSWINEDNELFISKMDGKQYFLYQFNTFPYMNTYAIRQDWLDKLGLKQPSNLEDWLTVARAFRDKDPNGNGIKDELAFGYGNWKALFYTAYNIKYQNNNRFALNPDGTLVPLYEHENYLECLELMASLYEEGLVDAEYLIRDDSAMKQLIITGVMGSFICTGGECASFTTAIRDTGYEDAVVQSIAPVQLLDGSKGFINGRAPVAQSLGITVNAEDPEACMQLLNYLFTEEGQLLTNYGVEGETFEYVNGEPKYKEEYANWASLREWGMNPISLVHPWAGDQFLQVTLAGKTYDELDDVEKLAYHGYFDTSDYAVYQLPSSVFSGDAYMEYATEVFNELGDMEDNVIMGLADIDDMKALIKELKEYALDDITAEVQANYAAIQ